MGRQIDNIRSMAANSRRDPFKGRKEGKGAFLFGRTTPPVAPARAKPAPAVEPAHGSAATSDPKEPV